ncbi:hypothetical protein E2C01_065902 [Portunus trituberculatus]|uniref:Transmembrane protein n=1 Tax=Portunus trituberculatus TaxID=210409 RepID=A0A5B7HSG9_PORTR|nr:hypothetical protein [Portunus trituberculatus]
MPSVTFSDPTPPDPASPYYTRIPLTLIPLLMTSPSLRQRRRANTEERDADPCLRFRKQFPRVLIVVIFFHAFLAPAVVLCLCVAWLCGCLVVWL